MSVNFFQFKEEVAKKLGVLPVGNSLSAEDAEERADHETQHEAQERRRCSQLESCRPGSRPIGPDADNQPGDPASNAENDCTYECVAQRDWQTAKELPDHAADSIHAVDYGRARQGST